METIHFSLFFIVCLGIHGSCSEILQRQKRNWIIDSFEIKEGYKGPFPYSLGTIDIEKDLTFFKIEGQGVNQDPKGVLKIDENTGEIFVHRAVDYETFPVLKLMFQAYDKQNNVLDTQLGIEIKIIDENDNAPVFQQQMYSATIRESTVQGSEVITIRAIDPDTNKKDGVFELKIVSVTPQQHDVEFYITQNKGSQIGTISFKGCLDHETAEKYTIIVEAKDQGEVVQHSSSCTVTVNIEDGNNHLPKITGQLGTGKVKEGEENIVISRLQVTDQDAKGTEAWRAKYQIHGDITKNFKIETDPETNEGLLYVEKALDFEDGPLKNLNITVENEIPYHSCKVVKRSETGLWQIATKTVASSSSGVAIASGGGAYQMTVKVEDVNEAPEFIKSNKQVTIAENLAAGQYLETFIAEDPDKVSKNTFIYKIGEDPAGWVTLDEKTGKITTKRSLDRESIYVKDNIYIVTINAIDDGKPPMTSTATLSIYIADENDNYPSVNISKSDMCQYSETSLVNITAFDLDEDPFGGPFRFKLLGDVDGKWRIYPRYGYSAKLLKEDTVHSGQYKLSLEVADSQHQTAVHNLTITVCECLNTVVPNCLNRRAASSTAGGGVFGIIFLGMLLFAGILLLAFLVSCKPEKVPFPPLTCEPDGSDQCLGDGNIETPGTDCEVVFKPLIPEPSQTQNIIKPQVPIVIMKEENTIGTAVNSAYDMNQMQQWRRNYLQWLQTSESKEQYQENGFMGQFIRGNNWSGVGSSTTGSRNSFMRKIKGFNYSEHELAVHREFLSQVLYTKLHNLQTPEEELGDYDPHVYADEEDRETRSELDVIAIPETSFDADLDQRLHFKFKTLASICMPHDSSAYSATTSNVMEESESASFIQMGSQETTMNTASHFDQVISLSGDLQHIMRPYGNTERIYVSSLDSASVNDSMETTTVWENVRISTDLSHGAQLKPANYNS